MKSGGWRVVRQAFRTSAGRASPSSQLGECTRAAVTLHRRAARGAEAFHATASRESWRLERSREQGADLPPTKAITETRPHATLLPVIPLVSGRSTRDRVGRAGGLSFGQRERALAHGKRIRETSPFRLNRAPGVPKTHGRGWGSPRTRARHREAHLVQCGSRARRGRPPSPQCSARSPVLRRSNRSRE